MCICEGHKCISIPNMKFLCLIMCTDNANDDTNDDANNDIARWTKHDDKRLFG